MKNLVRNSLKTHYDFHQAVINISTKVMQIPNYLDVKFNPEFISLICDLMQNEIKDDKSSTTVDKIELIIAIYKYIFPNITTTDLDVIRQNMVFFIDNKLIKKMSTINYIFRKSKKYMSKK